MLFKEVSVMEPPAVMPVAEMELAVLLSAEPRLIVPDGTKMLTVPPELSEPLAEMYLALGRVKSE